MMAPSADVLPEPKGWTADDARLAWRWDAREEQLVVSGFGIANMQCKGWLDAAGAAAAAEGGEGEEGEGEESDDDDDDDDEGGDEGEGEGAKGRGARLREKMGEGAGKARARVAGAGKFLKKKAAAGQAVLRKALGREPRPRLPPSAASAAALAGCPLESEDDVLHVRHPPSSAPRLVRVVPKTSPSPPPPLSLTLPPPFSEWCHPSLAPTPRRCATCQTLAGCCAPPTPRCCSRTSSCRAVAWSEREREREL